ncbi:helix-turn-helix domain-containing protein [Acutalibacter sp. 1XD8-36]|uniref:helix-turn-helix domain-containing protein n=1 Tax=Acutalibacter sp. 1XD8-36 TaxID=2320852 RepID=UPI0014131030|nr:helix-turn-helix transcriptional regulator [Acutalibacter sp. 1XD8-36]NBJ90993.1 XRE family transcriptional regulator [Acutalibacter sp. 1XD8-36]
MQVSTIATNTKRIIEERGLKKKAIAIAAGYSENQFSSLLNGRKSIKDSDVIALANALDVSPNDLFGWNGERNLKNSS